MALSGPSADGDLLTIPLSALEHHAYCPRQNALIHLEGIWADNVDTTRGDIAHRNVDIPGATSRKGTRGIRSLPVYSDRHGLYGICDLVEITGDVAVPIEYKISRYRPGGPAEIQLTAQAICLREAGYTVTEGYLYSATDRRRHHVPITDELTAKTLRAAQAVRQIITAQQLPPAVNDARCHGCSLREECLPEITDNPRRRVDIFRARPEGDWHD